MDTNPEPTRHPNPSTPPPPALQTNPDSISTLIETHQLTQSLRANPTLTETRPHLHVPGTMRAQNLMTGPLAGSHKISIAPYIFNDSHGQHLTMIFHLGENLCGHPGIVHGGLLATLLDEGLARCCFAALPEKVGVTASLSIEYRAPAVVNSFYVLVAETVQHEGRKAWVEGRIERLALDGEGHGEGEGGGEVVVEAKALFVQPRAAASLRGLYNA